MEDRQTWVDALEAWGPSVISGDFNAHHVSWDEYAQGMPRGAELYNWVEENEMAVLNDGKPTRAARFQQGCDLSASDITILNSDAADRFSWQPLNELSSDLSPILIKWNQLVKSEPTQRRVRPNSQKADLNLFRASLAEYQPLLQDVRDPATKLKTFVDCVQKSAAIAVHQNVCRKKETSWMNAELKTLIQERNRLRRNMGSNRDAWVAKTREVIEKTQEAKRNTWRAHLEEVTRTKDAKKAWAVVKSLNGSARVQNGETLDYKVREYVIDKAISSTQRPLGFVHPRCTHPPRRKAVAAHPSSLDCSMHDPTPRRRRSPPQKSRPNRPHPIPLRTPSPPPTLATYDRNVGDGQLPTLRGGRRVV